VNFYDNYIALCNRAGKSPSAVALEIGLTKPTITRWKNGSTPTDATMRRVADYVDVPVESIKYGLSVQELTVIQALEDGVFEENKKPADQKADGLRGLGYYDLTPENQKMIDALIDSLLKSQSGEQ
jgi:transcriptional regulator with XRE-family HTH domain